MATPHRSEDLIAEARECAGPDNGGWKPFDQNERIRHWRSPSLNWKVSEEFYADVEAWEAAHGHDVRLKCYPEFQCQVIESYLEWLVARLADALEAAEAERDAALAVIEKAREAVKSGSRMDANPTRLGGPPECMEGDRWWQSWHLQADAAWRKNMTEALSSVPADVLRERVAEKWDEGAKWAAVELGAIDNERQAWITPTDNPYRQTGEETDV